MEEKTYEVILVDGRLGIWWHDEDREDAERRVRDRAA